jgi:hypothetical protein
MKVLLFARDPGGANAVVPLAPILAERGHEVLLYGKDAALKQYLAYGQAGLDLAEAAPEMSVDSYAGFLQQLAPDFLITATGSDDFAEKLLWQAAERLAIPSFAILDHWFNYGIRFSPYKLVEQELYEQDKRHPFLPSRILVMDDEVREAMIQEGFAPERILVSGQPHFDSLRQQAERFSAEDVKQYRAQQGIAETDFLLCFISENITEPDKGDDLDQYYWGYTERSVFCELLDALQAATAASGRKVHVVVKPHPNETFDAYSDLIAAKAGDMVSASIDTAVHPVKLCKAVDLVCGMSSMVLVEAVILGLLVLSVQIGLRHDNPFILDKKGVVKSILNRRELQDKLTGYLTGMTMEPAKFSVPTGAAERIIKWMEEWR